MHELLRFSEIAGNVRIKVFRSGKKRIFADAFSGRKQMIINRGSSTSTNKRPDKMVKIRLQRHGKKGKPFYQIVVANSVDKRDGRFIENLGTYNPNTNPATINLNVDRAVDWLEKGAQPTLTANRILSYKGALLKKHLNGGVRKGAFTQEVADAKFAEWLKAKEAKVSGKVETLAKTKAELKAEALKAEQEEAAGAEEAAAEAPAEQENAAE